MNTTIENESGVLPQPPMKTPDKITITADNTQYSVWFTEAKKTAQVPFLYHQVLECGYDEMEHTIEEHDITLRIPQGAVTKGEKFHIEIGVAMYGPFAFPKNSRPISPILWLCVMKKDIVALKKEFQIILPHFLTELTTERLHYHQVGFAKASHSLCTLKSDQIVYKFKECKTPTLFASGGGKSYGVLLSDHCCFYCLKANQSPELVRNASYCFARIESYISSEIFFVASFFLNSCLKAWKEQFPEDKGYNYSRCVIFKFKTDESMESHIKILPQKKDQFDIALDPSGAQIWASEIDFWMEDLQMMSLKHAMKMYPPRVKMTVMAKSCDDTRHVLPVQITGCSREGQLDMDLTIGPGLQSASSPFSSSGSTLVPLLENHSKNINTKDGKPELHKALKELLPLAAHWKTIGGLLGIHKDILDKIKRDEEGVDDCLHEMLARWLKQVAPPPTWKDIADVIEVIDQLKAQTLRQRLASTGSDNSLSE